MSAAIDNLKALNDRLGYQFKNLNLLETALTHRSFAALNNERLEFLGDSLLNFLMGQKVYQDYPDLTEGDLSRLRANLVNGDVLAEIARGLKINQHMRLGAGELKSGGPNRRSILSNAMEAVIGAVFLDGGLDECKACVLRLFKERFEILSTEGVKKDPKTQLQECVQSKKMSLPYYEVLSIEGREHNQVFKVQCRIPDTSQAAVGSGTSRRRAEQDAAKKLLAIIK